ncbi:MAG: glycosyltransferase, partial [Bacteroidota bacterium]
MHVLIQTMGSRGDVQPYIALGLGLVEAGHRVTINTSTRFEAWVRGYGFEFLPLKDDLLKLLDSNTGLIEDMGSPMSAIRTARRMLRETKPIQRALFWDGWAAAETVQPDLIVYHPKMSGAIHYAEKLEIPVVLGTPIAQFVPTSVFPSIGMPAGPAAFNRATYHLVLMISKRVLAPYAKEWRAAHGLAPQPRGIDPLHTASGDPVPVLHAISPQVVPEPPDWPDSASMTGYWFLDVPDWSPPDELAAFLDAGEPPVYVGFGSMSGRQPERLATLVVEALQRAGVRGLLAKGWGGLDPQGLPASIHVIDRAPHDALFPR